MTSLVKQSKFEAVAVARISAVFVATMAVTYLVRRSGRMVLVRIGPRGIDAATRIVGFFRWYEPDFYGMRAGGGAGAYALCQSDDVADPAPGLARRSIYRRGHDKHALLGLSDTDIAQLYEQNVVHRTDPFVSPQFEAIHP